MEQQPRTQDFLGKGISRSDLLEIAAETLGLNEARRIGAIAAKHPQSQFDMARLERLRLLTNQARTGFPDGFRVEQPRDPENPREIDAAVHRIIGDSRELAKMLGNAVAIFPGSIDQHNPDEFGIKLNADRKGVLHAQEGNPKRAAEVSSLINLTRVPLSMEEAVATLQAQLTQYLKKVGICDVRSVMRMGS